MSEISISLKEKSYFTKKNGNILALKKINIIIRSKQFISIVGPSGCGKTTLLRCIAGLEIQSTGSVIQKKIDISNLPPSMRDFGIVFQSYALFPNLSVFFPVDILGCPPAEISGFTLKAILAIIFF